MKKILGLLTILLFLNGCAETVALLGTSASNGRIIQSSISSSISYGVKKQTGKTPLEHAIAYAEQKNPQEKKEPCLTFLEKTNSEICVILKKQINSTKSKIKSITGNKSLKDLTSSLQPKIDKKSKIKYLD
ncbi:MAG: hypothetical protein CMJ00_02320 [Pelagibacteraceae bacterium]|nr:hypothetical protein [Pelagibacteraceae bacterium]|tara:strand:- start:39 stop:431 length:393 start_codon:yes stop_codon:yes gene_type:complete